MDDLVVDDLVQVHMDDFFNAKWKIEFVYLNSDQIINQSATRLSMDQVLMDQNYCFMKTHAK